jgi:putative ABC transport system permease protein
LGPLLGDLRQALRRLGRERLLTLLASVTLGLGVGANTAVFSFADALLFRPFPFEDLDRLVLVWESHPQQGGQANTRSATGDRNPVAPADYLELRRECRALEGLAAFRGSDFVLLGAGGAERLTGARVAPEFFRLLRVPAVAGRTLLPGDDQPGGDGAVVISHGLWQRRLGGAPDVVGRPLVLDGLTRTVVGVMPANFAYPPGNVEVWAPLVLSEAERAERERLTLAVLGRLAPGVSPQQARDELLRLAARLEREHPASHAGRSFGPVLLREQQAGFTAPFAALFQGATLLVLVLACANLGAVLLARSLARRRELAVRAALGASPLRLARQLLTESLATSALGGLLALLVARAGVGFLRDSIPPDITKWIYGWDGIGLDARALLFGLGAVLFTAVATGLGPALTAWRQGPLQGLRQGGRGLAGGDSRARTLLVVGQMALALVLVVGATLMVRGFRLLMQRYQGFDPASVVTFRLRLPGERYPNAGAVSELQARLLERLAALPGAEAAGVVSHLPADLGPAPGGPVSVRGATTEDERALPVADYQAVSPGYFPSLRIALRGGRAFVEADAADTRPVAIVSESMARRLWPDRDPIGQQLKLGRPEGPESWREVVGVAQDVTQYWFDRQPRSILYLPYRQAPRANSFFVVRGPGLAAGASTLQAQLTALDPELPLDEVRTLDTVVDEAMAILLLAARLLVGLGGVAVVLSAIGVYGLIAHDVARRTPEIGVRLALGARPDDVRRLVLSRATRLALAGVALGLPAALAFGRLMAGRLFGVVRLEPWSLAALGVGLLALALLAALPLAQRAARVDPLLTLRSE